MKNDHDAEAKPRGRPQRSLLARALSYLARREHSRAQLRRKLAPFAESPLEVEALLDQLQQGKLLSEERFAESLARSRGERFGTARVAHELKRHGLDGELLRSTTTRLQQTELARARAVWSRKFGTPATTAAERARQIRFLMQRGFAADVVRRVVGGNDDE